MKLPILKKIGLPKLYEVLIRGGALFFGAYLLLSWIMSTASPHRYDANIWWIDLRGFPEAVSALLTLAFSAALIHRAICPAIRSRARRLRLGVLVLLIAVLLMNSLNVWALQLKQGASGGGLSLGSAIPLTTFLAIGVLLTLNSPHDIEPPADRQRTRRWATGFATVFCASGFAVLGALSQMVFFGESDYRRPADAILVYGCRAYANGQPSQALADRVNTACELYHQGLAPRIVMSGGPGDGSIHETQAMADYAVSLGVPRSAILCDLDGLDTQSTAQNLADILAETDADNSNPRVLAVSHDFHLPRIKLSLEREGITTYTVPAVIRRGLPSKPYLMARETAAWWYYYLNPPACAAH